ncbi:unnamed protein product [Caenorhabditis bovis]|uniref:Uncharacterized protein n=1 Tax=Caenorhabditis bovis TaxID=2654633 RepID=A0A8S1FCE4_9PELO|nr:unnamed protein product [Caenorhabditis bovis]
MNGHVLAEFDLEIFPELTTLHRKFKQQMRWIKWKLLSCRHNFKTQGFHTHSWMNDNVRTLRNILRQLRRQSEHLEMRDQQRYVALQNIPCENYWIDMFRRVGLFASEYDQLHFVADMRTKFLFDQFNLQVREIWYARTRCGFGNDSHYLAEMAYEMAQAYFESLKEYIRNNES